MKKYLLVALLILGCQEKKNEEATFEPNQVLYYGLLNKNISHLYASMKSPTSMVSAMTSIAPTTGMSLDVDLKNLKFSASIYDGAGCHIEKPLPVNSFLEIKKFLDSVVTCVNTQTTNNCYSYIGESHFSFNSKDGTELSMGNYNLPGCGKYPFPCDMAAINFLEKFSRDLVQPELASCP